MDIKRTLAGASLVGLVGLPAWLLGAGVAAADPAPAPAPQQCTDPNGCPPPPSNQKSDKKNNASGIKIPEAWSREVAKNFAALPPPFEANGSVPVNIGLPDVVPDISVPLVLNPPNLSIPAPKLPAPKIAPPKVPDLWGPFAKLTPW